MKALSILDKIRKLLWIIKWQIKVLIQYFPQHVTLSVNYLLHNNDAFENELIIITKVNNEAGNMKEWIEYHKMMGVEKFIIYDNESTDNLQAVLQPYIDAKEVILRFRSGNLLDFQVDMVNETVREYRNKARWIALIDVDEFIVPVKHANILDAISAIAQDTGKRIHALAISWVLYGYSGHKVRPEGLVIENYMERERLDLHVKSVINPRMVAHCWIHHVICLFGLPQRTETGLVVRDGILKHLSDISIETIRINHYHAKSYEEHIRKIKRYHRLLNIREEDMPIPDFESNIGTYREDRIMDKFIPQLKKRIISRLI